MVQRDGTLAAATSQSPTRGHEFEGGGDSPTGSAAARAPAILTPEQELEAFRRLLLVRRFEEKAGQLYAFGEIGGYCHLSIWQEAVAVGLALAAAPGDQMINGHRCHAHLLAAGAKPSRLMAELLGRTSGLCGGKGGSMHLFEPEIGFFGGHGIVGACVPIGAGLAFANSYRDTTSVTWCCFGDRAADQGQVAETLNMAALWRLPLVLVIENNAGPDAPLAGELWRRGEPYSIPGSLVDGVSVTEVHAACLAAAQRARAGDGPTILEMRTFPFRGHLQGEAEAALSPEEVEARRRFEDPLERAKARLLTAGIASKAELRALDDEVRDLVAEAAETARADAEPGAETLQKDVVADGG
jgi:pyruvate dehydrogenase E1 component alpha subunit